MKKIIGIMLLTAALTIPGLAQSLTDVTLQLQNPKTIYINETLTFGSPISEVGEKRSLIVLSKMDTNPYGKTSCELFDGTWDQSGDNLTINLSNGVTLHFTVLWLTGNTVKLMDGKNPDLVYAKFGSPEDHYAENLFKNIR